MADAESSPKSDALSLFDRLFSDNTASQAPQTSSGFIPVPFGLTMDQLMNEKHPMLGSEGSIHLDPPTIDSF